MGFLLVNTHVNLFLSFILFCSTYIFTELRVVCLTKEIHVSYIKTTLQIIVFINNPSNLFREDLY